MRAFPLFSALLAGLALSACATNGSAPQTSAAPATTQAAQNAEPVAPVTPPRQPAAQPAPEPVPQPAEAATQARAAAQAQAQAQVEPAATPAAQPDAAPARPLPRVALATTMGTIVIELENEKAPKTVANFLQYAKAGFYTGTIFHRVEEGFVIQAGGYDVKRVPKRTRKPIVSEGGNGLSNVPYSVAMARQDDPNSATSQFFINLGNNVGLDRANRVDAGYTVFGRVVEGKEVVDKISRVVIDDKPGFANIPVVPIVIKSTKVVKVK